MVARREVAVGGVAAHVWTGGRGDPLLLLHGGWGGAHLHWAPVWDRLAERFLVVAPDLPGLGEEGAALGSLSAYATWLEHLLDATGVGPAWVVGNSFGAGLAWRLASQAPARCLGLVLVNGGPAPSMPPPARRLLAAGPARRAITAVFRRSAYSPSTAAKAFADPGRVPVELAEVFAGKFPHRLETVTDVVLSADPPSPPPRARTLLLWGASDRLLGTKASAAERLQRKLAGSELVLIPGAGHLPQLERPAEFVDALTRFAAAVPPPQP